MRRLILAFVLICSAVLTATEHGPEKGTLVIDSPTMTLEELEKEYIIKVLHHTRWQKKRASEILGINASTLYRKLISYGFEKGAAEDGMGEVAA